MLKVARGFKLGTGNKAQKCQKRKTKKSLIFLINLILKKIVFDNSVYFQGVWISNKNTMDFWTLHFSKNVQVLKKSKKSKKVVLITKKFLKIDE